MANSNKSDNVRVTLIIGTLIFSALVWIWLATKYAIIDLVMTIVLWFVLLFPMAALALGLMSDDGYALWARTINRTVDTMRGFLKGKDKDEKKDEKIVDTM